MLSIIICGCLISMIGFGIRSTLGLFVTPISLSGGPDAQALSLTFALQNLIWGFCQPLAGAAADKFGTTRTMIIGAVLYAAGPLIMAYSTSAEIYYLAGGLLMGTGIAFASFSLVLAAFARLLPKEMTPLAFGLGTAAGSAGQLVFAPAGYYSISTYGWQSTFLLFSAAMLFVIPLSFFISTSKKKVCFSRAGCTGRNKGRTAGVCAVMYVLTRQAILALYPILVIVFHFSWLFPSSLQGTIELAQAEADILTYRENTGYLFRLIGYAPDGKIHYIPQAIISAPEAVSGGKNRRIYAGSRLIAERASLRPQDGTLVLLPGTGVPVYNLTYEQRYFSGSHLFYYLKARATYYIPDTATFFRAMVLGDRTHRTADNTAREKSLGIYHLYAVSGQHTGLIMLFLFLGFRMLLIPLASFTGLAADGWIYRRIIVTSLIMTGLYAYLISYPVTVMRAWLMLLIWLIASARFGYYPWYVLLLHTAGWMLTASPLYIADYGFILSFLSVAAVFLSAGIFAKCDRRFVSPLRYHLKRYILQTVMISVAVTLLALPIFAALSGSFSLLIPLNNIIHIAYFSFIVLPAGFLALIAGLLFYGSSPNITEGLFFELFSFTVRIWQHMIDLNMYISEPFTFPLYFPEFPGALVLYYAVLSLPCIFFIRRWHKNHFPLACSASHPSSDN
ncbi:hypothetical protein CHS0354_018514 [Potamilus streckersoni]|uniref:Major facilitator superfamily (MFS) profile domain-containing protein n=1 Tax=Potamilus streckersoni TaxID=2493646 RepID=A0AAE0TBE0_9BIVA|nr:hypothetical protein CHS0354_018514 [Potamilus streckersoni]